MKKWTCWVIVCGTWALSSLVGCGRGPAPAKHAERNTVVEEKTADPEKRFADAFAEMWNRGQECVAVERRLVEYQRLVAQPNTPAHQQRQDFLHRFFGLMKVAGVIPDLALQRQTTALKKILAAHKPELADRLAHGEFDNTLGQLFDGPLEWDGVRWAIPVNQVVDPITPPAGTPLAEWERNCAEYFAEWVRDYSDVSREWKGRQKKLDDDTRLLTEIKEGLSQFCGAGPDGNGLDVLCRLRDVLRKHHPEIADAASGLMQQGQVSEVQYVQERVKKDLAELYAAQMRFRNHDRDGNGVRDFWTGDVSGLFRWQCGGQRLELIPARLAHADGAPLAAGGYLGALPARTEERTAFAFQAVPLDADGRPLGMDTDHSGLAWRNRERFAICAYPMNYGRVGRQSYLVTEQGTVWFKDTEGKPIERLPRDPKSEGWEVAVENVASQATESRR